MGRLAKVILNKITKNALSTVNQRLNTWKKSPDIDDETYKGFMDQINSIEGVTINAKGKVIATGDLDNVGINTLKEMIPTLTQMKKNLKEIDKEFTDIKFEHAQEKAKTAAELSFKMEVRRLRNKALDELWDYYYEDHDEQKGSRKINSGMYEIEEDELADIADEMHDLGSKLGRGEASVEEVQELVQKIKLARGINL